jgi:hypothetical protein
MWFFKKIVTINKVILLITNLGNIIWWRLLLFGLNTLLKSQNCHELLIENSTLPNLDGAIVKSNQDGSDGVNSREVDASDACHLIGVVDGNLLVKVDAFLVVHDVGIELDERLGSTLEGLEVTYVFDSAVGGVNRFLSDGLQTTDDKSALVCTAREVALVLTEETTSELLSNIHGNFEHMLRLQFFHIEPLDDTIAEANEPLVLLCSMSLTISTSNENNMAIFLVIGDTVVDLIAVFCGKYLENI